MTDRERPWTAEEYDYVLSKVPHEEMDICEACVGPPGPERKTKIVTAYVICPMHREKRWAAIEEYRSTR